MDEHILAARLRGDEAVAFGRVEEFHGSSNAHLRRSFPGKAWLGRSNKGRTHGPAAQMMWKRQTAPRGQAAKPQILRRAPLWSAPAGGLYGSGLLRTQDTIELAVRFCTPILRRRGSRDRISPRDPCSDGQPGWRWPLAQSSPQRGAQMLVPGATWQCPASASCS